MVSDVAFCGYAGSGKTTAANILVEKYGYVKHGFAAPLKRIAVALWGEDAMQDRGKLQDLGLSIREIEEDTWLNLLMGNINPEERIVVDDCRFPNEYWGLAAHGFTFVWIDVPEELRVARLMRDGKLQSREQLYHESETALNDYQFDHTLYIRNDDLAEYEAEIDRLAQHVFMRQP